MMVREETVEYNTTPLPEKDHLYDTEVALPPNEHHVLVAWYNGDEQLNWIRKKGIALVRLGSRRGAFHAEPTLSTVRHVLFRTHNHIIADGLWQLKEPGFKVFTKAQVAKKFGYESKRAKEGDIYAVFEVEPDSTW